MPLLIIVKSDLVRLKFAVSSMFREPGNGGQISAFGIVNIETGLYKRFIKHLKTPFFAINYVREDRDDLSFVL